MRDGFNYGLLVPAAGAAILWLGGKATIWLSRRSARRAGDGHVDVRERLDRAEAAIREAREEIASARAELASHR